MDRNDMILGLILGAVVGASLGVLLAPKSGKEIRHEIRDSAVNMVEKAKHKMGMESGAEAKMM